VLSRRHGCLAEEITPLLLPGKEPQFVQSDKSYKKGSARPYGKQTPGFPNV
jgi:hypothetical protein